MVGCLVGLPVGSCAYLEWPELEETGLLQALLGSLHGRIQEACKLGFHAYPEIRVAPSCPQWQIVGSA